MSDTHGPIWIVEEPAKPYHDGRFDGVTTIAPADVPEDEAYLHAMRELNRAHGISPDPIKIGVDHPHYKPPLDPQQPMPDPQPTVYDAVTLDMSIANATRRALPDIETVFRHWGYIQTHPLPELRALLDMLTPPAPEWQAKDEDE